MAKDPGDRFETCGELVEAARQALNLAPESSPSGLRRWLPAAVAVIAVLVAALAIGLSGGGDGADAASATGALVRIDPSTNRVAGRTAVDGFPGSSC